MEIKTENIEVGQSIKNYKVLCGLLGADIKKGKSKQLQLQDWERYFRYSRDGNKYTIEEIYEEPAPKIDKRKFGNTNNSVYGGMVQELVMDLLLRNAGKLFNPLNFFLKEFWMTNGNYKVCEDNVPKLALLLQIDEYNIYEFYTISRKNLRDVFETALKALEKRQFIRWIKVPMVCITETTIENNELNTPKLLGKGNTYVKCVANTIHREATQEEIKLVKETEGKLLSEKGFENIQRVIFAGKYPDFKKELEEILFEKGNIDYLYSNYKIDIDDAAYEQILEEINADGLKARLNDLVSKNMMENAEKRHLSTREKYSHIWGEVRFKSKSDKYRYNEAYPEIYSELVAVLISRYADQIGEKIDKISQKDK